MFAAAFQIIDRKRAKRAGRPVVWRRSWT